MSDAFQALSRRVLPLAAAVGFALAASPALARGPDGIADVAEKVIDAVVNISTSQTVEAKNNDGDKGSDERGNRRGDRLRRGRPRDGSFSCRERAMRQARAAFRTWADFRSSSCGTNRICNIMLVSKCQMHYGRRRSYKEFESLAWGWPPREAMSGPKRQFLRRRQACPRS